MGNVFRAKIRIVNIIGIQKVLKTEAIDGKISLPAQIANRIRFCNGCNA